MAERDISIQAGLFGAGEDIVLQAGRDIRVGHEGALKAVNQIYAFAENEIRNEGLLLSGKRIDLITETGDVFNAGRIEVGEIDLMSILLEKYGGSSLLPQDAEALKYLLSLSPEVINGSSVPLTTEEIKDLFDSVYPDGYEEEESGSKVLVIRSGGDFINQGGTLLADTIALESEENFLNSGLIDAKGSISLSIGKDLRELGEEENSRVLAEAYAVLRKFDPSAPGNAPSVQNTAELARALDKVIARLEVLVDRAESGNASIPIDNLLVDLGTLRQERRDLLAAGIGEEDERAILSSGSFLNEGALIADAISMRIAGDYSAAGNAVLRRFFNSGSFRNTFSGSIIVRSQEQEEAGPEDEQPESQVEEAAAEGSSPGQGRAKAPLDIDADGDVYNYGYISSGASISIRARGGQFINFGEKFGPELSFASPDFVDPYHGDLYFSWDDYASEKIGADAFAPNIVSEASIAISANSVVNWAGGGIKAGESLHIEAAGEGIRNYDDATLSAAYVSLEAEEGEISNAHGGLIEGENGVSLKAKYGILNVDYLYWQPGVRSGEVSDPDQLAVSPVIRSTQGDVALTVTLGRLLTATVDVSAEEEVTLTRSLASIRNEGGLISGKSVYLDAVGDNSVEGASYGAGDSDASRYSYGVYNRKGGRIEAEELISIRAGAGDLTDQEQKDRIFTDAKQALDSLYATLDVLGIGEEELGLPFSREAYDRDALGTLESALRILENLRAFKGPEVDDALSDSEGFDSEGSDPEVGDALSDSEGPVETPPEAGQEEVPPSALDNALLVEAGSSYIDPFAYDTEGDSCAGEITGSLSESLCQSAVKIRELHEEASEAEYAVLHSGSIYNQGGSVLRASSIYISNRSFEDEVMERGFFGQGGRIEASPDGIAQIISQGKIDVSGALLTGGNLVLDARKDVLGSRAHFEAGAEGFVSINSGEGEIAIKNSRFIGRNLSMSANANIGLAGSVLDASSSDGRVSLYSREGDIALNNGLATASQLYINAERGGISNVDGDLRALDSVILIAGTAGEGLASDEDKEEIFTNVSEALDALRDGLSGLDEDVFDPEALISTLEEEAFKANVSGHVSHYLSALRRLALNDGLNEDRKQAVQAAIDGLVGARNDLDSHGYAGFLDSSRGSIFSASRMHILLHAGQGGEEGVVEGARFVLDQGSLVSSP